jgi:hypothetical protein
VPAALGVVYILTDDLPVLLNEGGLSEDLVGVSEAIQDESRRVSISPRPVGMLNARRFCHILMGEAVLV